MRQYNSSHRVHRRPALALPALLTAPLIAITTPSLVQAQDEATPPQTEAAQSVEDTDNPIPVPILPDERQGLATASALNNTVRPAQREHSAALLQQLQVPEGFTIEVFAEDLVNPRILEVAENGDIYVSEREAGRVTLLRDENEDGRADQKQAVAKGLGEGQQGVHGLALSPDGQYLYMATDTQLYRAEVMESGELGAPQLLLDELPDGGQHPNRTLEFGPDDMLYISIGSTSNAVPEPNELNATIVRLDPTLATPSVEDLQIVAEGLRNTIGFGWHPVSGALFGWDHNSDSRGDNWPPEEINQIVEGNHYGWPFCGGDREVDNQVSAEPQGMSRTEFCAQTEPPVATHTAHSAGMQIVYYTGEQFPAEYRNDAFITLRGSWNRNPPVGYEIVHLSFDEEGRPGEVQPFISGWLLDAETEPAHFGRLSGLAQAADGSLLVANDSHGVIYRISYGGE